jgi:hypothetical protein
MTMDPVIIIALANIVAKLVVQFMQANPNATQEEVDAHIAANLPLIQASIVVIQAEIAKYNPPVGG